ncbi:MAG: BrnA antitoxin family protein [Proteobacteria bacterium]|nr:BrnA antitoxin family protein [Pseudomonadota bacterium]
MPMPRKPHAGPSPSASDDDAPELTEAFFERAALYDGPRLVRRGRPPAAAPKRLVTLRLDPAVLDGLRATGPGWQTRANQALRAFLDQRAQPAGAKAPRSATPQHRRG